MAVFAELLTKEFEHQSSYILADFVHNILKMLMKLLKTKLN